MNARLFFLGNARLRRLSFLVPAFAACLVPASAQNTPPTKVPEVTISADFARIFTGENLNLKWSATEATSCSAAGAWSGTKATSGTQIVTVNQSGTLVYELSCVGPGGQANAETKVVADAPALSLTRSFSPNAVTLSNSEGAPYGFCNFWEETTSECTDETNFGYGPTRTVYIPVCLSGEVTINACSEQPEPSGALPQQMLQDIASRIAAFSGTGARLIVRFTYNFGPIGPNAKDVPADLIVQHIDQLAPILIRNKDIVLALEAGFIGTWGEWHDSTNGNDTAAAQKLVLDRELKYFSGLFPILVRYPGDLIQYTGTTQPAPGLGLHDDFYASNTDDGSTWNPCNPGAGYCLSGFTSKQLQTYGSAVSAATMFAGEFGALDPTLQACDALDAYSHTYNVQSITLTPFPTSIGTELEDEGCALSFYNKVGVRIELHKLSVIGNPVSGDRLDLAVTLSNEGYGRVIRPHPARVIFFSNGSPVAELPIPLADLDLRQLQPAAEPAWQTFWIHLHLPANFLLDGPSSIALVFPDPAPSLKSSPAYALPLNSIEDKDSVSVFDPTTGYNVIATFDVF